MRVGLSHLLEFEKDHLHYPKERTQQQQHTSPGSLETDRINDTNQMFQQTSLSYHSCSTYSPGIRSLESPPDQTGNGARNSLITSSSILQTFARQHFTEKVPFQVTFEECAKGSWIL